MCGEKNVCKTVAGTHTLMTDDNNRYFSLTEKGYGAYNLSI
jgi:hypothetical protein